MGVFKSIFGGLKKTKDTFAEKISAVFARNKELNDDFYDELETILLSGDVGVDAAEKIINDLRRTAKKQHIKTIEDVKAALRSSIAEILQREEEEKAYPIVYTIVGVNGVGKTTAIGKLAAKLTKEGKNVVMAAGDTFRAAASAQLSEWAGRAKVRIIKHAEGADPGAVVFDAIASAKSKGVDVLLIDTAGRLHNNVNLMEELKKVNRIARREWPEATHKNIIVLDASIGQNSLSQVELFGQAVELDGIILTKLDGTSKGGVVLQIKEKFNLPVLYVGVGEGIDDIEEFDANSFAEGLV